MVEVDYRAHADLREEGDEAEPLPGTAEHHEFLEPALDELEFGFFESAAHLVVGDVVLDGPEQRRHAMSIIERLAHLCDYLVEDNI